MSKSTRQEPRWAPPRLITAWRTDPLGLTLCRNPRRPPLAESARPRRRDGHVRYIPVRGRAYNDHLPDTTRCTRRLRRSAGSRVQRGYRLASGRFDRRRLRLRADHLVSGPRHPDAHDRWRCHRRRNRTGCRGTFRCRSLTSTAKHVKHASQPRIRTP